MRPFFGPRARLRWVHLILGGALLMPYFLLASVVVGAVNDGADAYSSLPAMLTAYATALPLAAVSALFPPARPMSVAAVRMLCAVPGELLAEGPAGTWAARARTAAWWTTHLGVGAVLSGMTLAVPPMALVLLGTPFFAALRESEYELYPWLSALPGRLIAPLLGAALLVALALCAAAAGALLARLAPVLLGPTPADRLAAAEERAADLAVRNRLARELHDSVGHALSAVTLQAAAARRVLDTDPQFVREALAAIEDTTRRTVGELDAVLGLLRDGDERAGPGAPAPTLAADLDGLLGRTRAGGVEVAAEEDPGPVGDWGRLPAIASREAYRIVQEGLSNVLKHGSGPVRLRITAAGTELEITMTNPLAAPAPGRPRTGGGRGLRGIAERAALLGGRAEAGEHDGGWRLRAALPLGTPSGDAR
ncbi:sensor histidine kinase [Streptomyces sp. NPDC101118]|uniref:sensor histidine kinase n=1 Tax=Streptomyces sp. NPDC101118 TaxID=3366109 RepID=UPI0037F35C8A